MTFRPFTIATKNCLLTDLCLVLEVSQSSGKQKPNRKERKEDRPTIRDVNQITKDIKG